jgi:hypothetical protein
MKLPTISLLLLKTDENANRFKARHKAFAAVSFLFTELTKPSGSCYRKAVKIKGDSSRTDFNFLTAL